MLFVGIDKRNEMKTTIYDFIFLMKILEFILHPTRNEKRERDKYAGVQRDFFPMAKHRITFDSFQVLQRIQNLLTK